jgi:hypothetical protein
MSKPAPKVCERNKVVKRQMLLQTCTKGVRENNEVPNRGHKTRWFKSGVWNKWQPNTNDKRRPPGFKHGSNGGATNKQWMRKANVPNNRRKHQLKCQMRVSNQNHGRCAGPALGVCWPSEKRETILKPWPKWNNVVRQTPKCKQDDPKGKTNQPERKQTRKSTKIQVVVRFNREDLKLLEWQGLAKLHSRNPKGFGRFLSVFGSKS